MRYGIITPVSQRKGLYYLAEAFERELIKQGHSTCYFSRFWDTEFLPESKIINKTVNWNFTPPLVRTWAEEFKVDRVIILESWGDVVKGVVDELKKYGIFVIDVPMWEMVSESDFIKNWYEKFDEIWCLTDATFKLFSARYEKKAVRTLIDSVDHSIFYPGPQLATDHYTFLIAPGLISKVKTQSNIDAVFGAFDKLRKEFPVTLRILGTGDYASIIDKRADVILIDKVLSRQDLGIEMQKADCFLATTVREGFGLMPREALACGLDVVGINVPPINEINGIRLVEPSEFTLVTDSLIPASVIETTFLYEQLLKLVKAKLVGKLVG